MFPRQGAPTSDRRRDVKRWTCFGSLKVCNGPVRCTLVAIFLAIVALMLNLACLSERLSPDQSPPIEPRHSFPFSLVTIALPLALSPSVQPLAVSSWIALKPRRVTIFVEDAAECAHWSAVDPVIVCKLITCRHPDTGYPTMDCVIAEVKTKGDELVSVFINTDIILVDDFVESLATIEIQMGDDPYVVVGERRDVTLKSIQDLGVRSADFYTKVRQLGKSTPPHGRWGMDYFAFGNGVSPTLPTFMVGVAKWDPFMMWSILTNVSISTITATESITCVHVSDNTRTRVPSGKRSEVEIHASLVQRYMDPKDLHFGSVVNTQKLLKCPKCPLAPNLHPEPDFLVRRYSTRSREFVLMLVEGRQLLYAANWVCWAKAMNFENYLMYTTSTAVAYTLPHVYFADSEARNFPDFIQFCLRQNFTVFVMEPTSVPFRHPFQFFNSSYEISLSHSLVVLRPSALTKRSYLLNCLFNNQTTVQGRLAVCLKKIGKDVFKRLDALHFPDPDAVFTTFTVQKKGVWPVQIPIHDLQTLRKWNRWDSDARECMAAPHELSASPPRTASDIRVLIKIITFSRHESLSRLLASLNRVDWLDTHPDVEFLIDALSNQSEHEADHAKVRELASSWKFLWGTKRITLRTKSFGLKQQWLQAWRHPRESEVCIVIEDDIELSPHYWRWTVNAVVTYSRDPYVFAICPHAPHSVYGSKPGVPSGNTVREQLSAANTPFGPWLYQLGSTWAPVLLPRHWLDFLRWQEQKERDPTYRPYWSNLVSNMYHERGPSRVWSSWWIAYVAERGLYSVYIHLPGNSSLAVNFREPGLNFRAFGGAWHSLAEDWLPAMERFPPSEELPLYDHHFNRIPTAERRLLSARSLLFPSDWPSILGIQVARG